MPHATDLTNVRPCAGAVVALVALMATALPAQTQPPKTAEAALAGTSWYELDVFEKLDRFTPAQRLAKQACDTPKRTFEVKDGKLVGHWFVAPDGSDTVYPKTVATATAEGLKLDLFEDAAAAKPSHTFVLLKDGESMLNPTGFLVNGLLKCKTVASPIPAAKPPPPQNKGGGRRR